MYPSDDVMIEMGTGRLVLFKREHHARAAALLLGHGTHETVADLGDIKIAWYPLYEGFTPAEMAAAYQERLRQGSSLDWRHGSAEYGRTAP